MTTDTLTTVSLEQSTYCGWPAYWLRRGELELVVTPAMGGRLMRVAWRGHDLAYTNPSYHGRSLDLQSFPDPRAAKREFGLRRYGGDHTWLAPQSRWTDGVPFLDLDSGPYTASVDENSERDVRLTVTSPVDRETGVQVSRTVRLSAARAGFELTHTLRNVSGKLAQWGIWDVLHLKRPGRVYMPRRKGSRFPNGVKTFEGEGQSVAVRDDVLKTTGPIVIADCSGDAHFKYGVDADQGWVLGIQQADSGSLVGYATVFEVFGRRPYGHSCTTEVSSGGASPSFAIEVHSALALLAPGQQTQLVEQRLLFDAESWPENEEQIRALIANAAA